MNPVPRTVQAAIGVGALAAALLLTRAGWSGGSKMVAFALVAGAAVVVVLHFQRRLPRGGGPEPAGPDEVMPGARAHVADFERAGFRRLGGFRWALRGRLVISSVLAPFEQDRYAIVTDRVLEVASSFGSRMLVTTNSGLAPAPPYVLRQVVRRGSPSALVNAHQAGLDRLADEGLVPDRFLDDADVLATVRETEERALREGRVPSFVTLLSRWAAQGDPPLEYDDESRLRIANWSSS